MKLLADLNNQVQDIPRGRRPGVPERNVAEMSLLVGLSNLPPNETRSIAERIWKGETPHRIGRASGARLQEDRCHSERENLQVSYC